MKLTLRCLSTWFALPALALSISLPIYAAPENSRQAPINAAVSLQCQWPQWQSFKQHYMEKGRVIDKSDSRLITTSEGQSYGLFFALIANDKEAFAQLLQWTEQHLAAGDLTARLPVWLWGKQESGRYGVLDNNSASDSDLWIAYSLIEAGRLWGNYYYQTLGHLLASRILREETYHLDGVGTVLLPGKQGFVLAPNHLRLNPSYVPLQILDRLKTIYPHYTWQDVYDTSVTLIVETLPKGFSPDWVELTPQGFKADSQTQGVGSYNAIRTYLWAGMLADGHAQKASIIHKMQPMLAWVNANKTMPEIIDTQTGQTKGEAGIGLTAAVIPLLRAAKNTLVADEMVKKVERDLGKITTDYYYQSVLSLFAMGWEQGRYQFDIKGQVIPAWDDECP